MNVLCPKCTSGEVRSLSLIYREGLSHSVTNTTGTGFGGARGGFGGGTMSAVSHGRSQTVLSKEAAPPSKKRVVTWLVLTVIFSFLFLGSTKDFGVSTLVFAGVAALSIWMAMNNREYNATQFPELYSRWQRSFMCNRCGAVFVV